MPDKVSAHRTVIPAFFLLYFKNRVRMSNTPIGVCKTHPVFLKVRCRLFACRNVLQRMRSHTCLYTGPTGEYNTASVRSVAGPKAVYSPTELREERGEVKNALPNTCPTHANKPQNEHPGLFPGCCCEAVYSDVLISYTQLATRQPSAVFHSRRTRSRTPRTAPAPCPRNRTGSPAEVDAVSWP